MTENGNPAFPDKVIGVWEIDGWYVGNAMQASTGLRTQGVSCGGGSGSVSGWMAHQARSSPVKPCPEAARVPGTTTPHRQTHSRPARNMGDSMGR